MSRRLTHEEFMRRLDKINPNRNFVVLSKYVHLKESMYVQTVYGICKRNPAKILRGNDANITTAINKTQYFINMAIGIHKTLYDYSKTVYVNNKTKIIITCKKHGDFEQGPGNHLSGKGCKKCSDIKGGEDKKMTLKDFIEKSTTVHGNLYNYDRSVYTNYHGKIEIGCSIHGYFYQEAGSHLVGYGCQECAVITRANKLKKSTKQFIEEASTVHKGIYSYKKTIYISSKHKVIITCKKHGDFEQEPSSHLYGCGCRKCASEDRIHNTLSYSGWESSGNISNRFDSFKVYIIKCWNEDEKFYKIGKTFTTVTERFRVSTVNCLLPYKWKLVKQIEGDAKNISILERELQNNNKTSRYIPKIPFQGMYECFSSINKETLNYGIKNIKRTYE